MTYSILRTENRKKRKKNGIRVKKFIEVFIRKLNKNEAKMIKMNNIIIIIEK